jgi:hypothetical protein
MFNTWLLPVEALEVPILVPVVVLVDIVPML